MKQQCILINVDNNATHLSLEITKEQSIMKLHGDKNDVNISFNAKEFGIPPETTFTYLGDRLFVNDVYNLISASKGNQKVKITMLKANTNIKSVNLSNSTSLNKPLNLIKVREVSSDKGNSNNEDHSRFQPPSNQNQSKQADNKADYESLKSLAKLLNDKYNIKMNANEQVELLLESIKRGIQQLAERQIVPQQPIPQSTGQNPQKQLNEISRQAAENLKRAQEAERTLKDNKEIIENLNNDIEVCNKINAELVEQNNNLTKQIEQLSSSGLDLKGELIATICNLKSDIELGDYIFTSDSKSCGDAFLATQTDYLIQDIQKISVSTTAELRKEIKNVLRNTLKGNDNLFSKLAIILAYSRLPFMIEPSNQGQYLKPQRINSIFGKAYAILATYGFQLSIPSLFVETLGDGEYIDVTGSSISPLTEMCPLLSQHKERVDRGQRDNVITDIIYTGFSEDDNIIEKTKVIV